MGRQPFTASSFPIAMPSALARTFILSERVFGEPSSTSPVYIDNELGALGRVGGALRGFSDINYLPQSARFQCRLCISRPNFP
jgi:hypothetical protein